MEKNWIKIRSFDKEYLSQIAKEVLSDNEIESVIINKQDGAYKTFGEFEVYVHIDFQEKAMECLKELE